jgi:hypothetical protein
LLSLQQSVDTMFAAGADQRSAFNFRLPGPALLAVVASALVAAFMIGLSFGQSRAAHWLISTFFCLALVGLVYVIIDLDSPRAGLVRVNLAPLIEARQSMQGM